MNSRFLEPIRLLLARDQSGPKSAGDIAIGNPIVKLSESTVWELIRLLSARDQSGPKSERDIPIGNLRQ